MDVKEIAYCLLPAPQQAVLLSSPDRLYNDSKDMDVAVAVDFL